MASAVLGEYLAGSIVVLMLSGGTALEVYATREPPPCLRRWPSGCPHGAPVIGSGIVDISLAESPLGDKLVVFPHEICPVDGVVEGRGTMDEAYLTGEPFQIAKAPGAEFFPARSMAKPR